jgi:23S rRNA pseudouridine955/2504/2580 synthase
MIHRVESVDVGARLDRWLKANIQVPHSLVQRLLRQGKVRVNGRKVKADYRLAEGDSVEVKVKIEAAVQHTRVVNPKLLDNLLSQINSLIVFMDEHILAINKPYDVAVQGGSHVKISIDDALDSLRLDCPERPRIVHRLDRHTTGLLLIARTKRAAQALGVLFKEHGVMKKYLAILTRVPDPKQGVVRSDITKDGENAREAVTKYEVVKVLPDRLSLVEFIPVTGRTHQIRIHAARDLGIPILGDQKYSHASEGMLCLHAHEIVIKDLLGRSYHLKADLPAHISRLLQ